MLNPVPIRINSLTPFLAKFSDSVTKSSIGLETYLPRINGMAQKNKVYHSLQQFSNTHSAWV